MIDSETIQFYRSNGWVVVGDVLTATQLEGARLALREALDGAKGLTAHDDRYDLEPDHRPNAPRVRRLKSPHQWHPFFNELMRTPSLIALFQALLDSSGVRLLGSKLNIKGPSGGSAIEWHQDWAFDPHTNDSQLAAGVMLDDCTTENGAMLVLPGSHTGPVYDHHADGCFCGAIDLGSAGIDVSRAVACVGKAGAISFHHVRTVHGSAANQTTGSRSVLFYEVAAVDAWPLNGVADFNEFNNRILVGTATIAPRLREVPVRMPLPPASRQGSIYENQLAAKNRYFAKQPSSQTAL
jgi:ectoine hydroxylase-related dioxygenase (phytanoyl-CoA dioxygenase family)